jgi:hypothetical protein
MSVEYYEDDLYPKLTPGRRGVARGQRTLHRAVRTADPWHEDIDRNPEDDDYEFDDQGGYEEGGYEGNEGDDTEDKYWGWGKHHHHYYTAGASLADDDDLSDEEEIGLRGRRLYRRGRRRFRRRRLGAEGSGELREKQAETKEKKARLRALKKERAQGRKLAAKEKRAARRDERRAERLKRRIAREEARARKLDREIAKLQGAPEPLPRDLDEDAYGRYTGSEFTDTVHNLRYAGDILPAQAGSAVFSVKGMLTAGKSIYDTDLGRAYFHRVLEHDDEDFFGSREEALDFVSEHFGLDFTDAKEDEHTGALTLMSGDTTVAKLEPFTINTDLDTSVDGIKGFGDDADASAVVHEGGWRATLHADATLYGLYGGEEGKRASKGDALFYYETHVQNEESEVPVIFHFESHEPVSMKPKDGKIQTELAVQYLDLLHPDPEIADGVADRTIRLKESGTNACSVNISTNVHF